MRLKHTIALLLFFCIVVSITCGWLAKQNIVYKSENRTLLLQNDSLLSLNLGLKNELKKYKKEDYSRINRH
jgi:hypothetical protein